VACFKLLFVFNQVGFVVEVLLQTEKMVVISGDRFVYIVLVTHVDVINQVDGLIDGRIVGEWQLVVVQNFLGLLVFDDLGVVVGLRQMVHIGRLVAELSFFLAIGNGLDWGHTDYYLYLLNFDVDVEFDCYSDWDCFWRH